eukprot:TRINITY_DN407_c0_g1_i1.p9 TRINITY_DN407_c0_g1~~TRINITY_DN407_c0_g1_i1.p9  ORF type:complete len:51 (-),score=9.56 TRINITY_DN407_c0_g1_i1:977-1129(-)
MVTHVLGAFRYQVSGVRVEYSYFWWKIGKKNVATGNRTSYLECLVEIFHN